MRLTAAVTKDEHVYVAECLEVDVASQGETIESALGNLREALTLYFEVSPGAVADLRSAPIIAPVEIELSTAD